MESTLYKRQKVDREGTQEIYKMINNMEGKT